MKLKISYATKEKKYHGKFTFSFVTKRIELVPVRILRRPCGSGAAALRYYYQADFKAPDDAKFVNNGLIRENIGRKINPHFKPKQFNFENNICECEDGTD